MYVLHKCYAVGYDFEKRMNTPGSRFDFALHLGSPHHATHDAFWGTRIECRIVSNNSARHKTWNGLRGLSMARTQKRSETRICYLRPLCSGTLWTTSFLFRFTVALSSF